MRIRLWTINKVLRRFGLCLTVMYDVSHVEPTVLMLERYESFLKRAVSR